MAKAKVNCYINVSGRDVELSLPCLLFFVYLDMGFFDHRLTCTALLWGCGFIFVEYYEEYLPYQIEVVSVKYKILKISPPFC